MRAAIPAAGTNLTPEERALLPDPDRVTEDDADAIIGLRRLKESSVSLEEYLRRRGYELDD